MTKHIALVLLALILPAGAAMAQDTSSSAVPPARKVCLRVADVGGYRALDNQTLIVSDRLNKKYKVSLAPGCWDVKWHNRLGFKSFGFALSCLRRGDQVLVRADSAMPAPQACQIQAIEAYAAPN